MQLQPVSENAIMLYLEQTISDDVSIRIQHCAAIIEKELDDILIDLVPSYASLLILYQPLSSSHVDVMRRIRKALADPPVQNVNAQNCVVLPVYYAPEAGVDLETLAERANLSIAQVIELHSTAIYRVYAIGFAPGFAYLGQVDPRIAAPRHATPRAQVPRGSVAIADRQTAVYPTASPGGWNLIGRCPVPMFNAHSDPSMPVSVGDTVRFSPIDRDEYLKLGGSLT